MSAKLISIIGPPASGKTLLGEKLATELSGELIREDYSGNPFLAESYVGSTETRLPSQLFFLFSRLKQLQEANWSEEGIFVSDYGFCQDAIFARQRLNDRDLEVYRRIASLAPRMVHSPDLIISLDASTETLIERIAQRGRDYESAIDNEFIGAMRKEYSSVAGRADCQVITIDTDVVDLRDPQERAKLIEVIRRKL